MRIDSIVTTAKVGSTMQSEIQECLNTVNKNDNVPIHFFAITETVDPEQWLKQVQNFIDQVNKNFPHIHHVFILLDITYKNVEKQISFTGITDYVFVDFDFISLYHRNGNTKSNFNLQWNYQSSNFLFLVGKANKLNRIALLKLIVDYGLLDMCTFSLHCSEDDIKKCHDYLSNLSNTEIVEFFEQVNNTTVDINFTGKDKLLQSASGLTNNDIFSQVLFNLNSETWFDRLFWSPMITEKTYKSILNCVPFIIAGELYTCKELQKRGFKTFNEYLAIPNYDNPDEENFLQRQDGKLPLYLYQHVFEFYNVWKPNTYPKCTSMEEWDLIDTEVQEQCLQNFMLPILDVSLMRLYSIIENIRDWLTNIDKYKTQIQQDIDHNYRRAKDLSVEYNNQWQCFTAKHGLNVTVVDIVFNIYRYSTLLNLDKGKL